MHLLLCAATEFELAPTITFLHANHYPVSVVITGVGLTASVYNLTKAVCINRPGYLLQAGIAGALGEDFLLGDVVVVKTDTIGDSGVEEKNKFHSVFDMGFQNKNRAPWQNGNLVNPMRHNYYMGLPEVNAVTVNEITTNANRITYYRQHLDAQIESMEGAALHYVGLMENIPFLQIRSLSNFVGERDKLKWNSSDAIINLNQQVQIFIKNHFNQ